MHFSLALGYRSEHGALASHYLTGIDLIENYKKYVCVSVLVRIPHCQDTV